MRYRRIGLPMSEATGNAKQSPGLPRPPQPPFTYDYFVSPTGSAANPGTLASPWTLDYAIAGAGGLVVPGIHIGCLAGQYIISSSRKWTITGTLANPIIWRNYNGQHVEWICDSSSASIEVNQLAAAFNYYWGIDGWRKKIDRYNYPGPGSVWYVQNASANGVKLIHCFGHEGSNGFFTDSNIGNVELYGCVSYHAGTSTDPRAHGFYVHHTRDSGVVGSRLSISEHITFDHLGNCGQIFASGSPEQLDDIDLLGVIAWGGGRIAYTTGQQNLTVGGTDGTNIPLRGFTGKHIISRNPVGYGRSCFRFYNNGSTGQDANLEDSYFVGGKVGEGIGRLGIGVMNFTSFTCQRNTMVNLEQTQILNTDDTTYTGWTWNNNNFYGSDATATKWRNQTTDKTFAAWSAYTGKGGTDTVTTSLPATTQVFVRAVNKYEYGRGHVVYFNFAGLNRIPVDLSSFLAVGDQIIVRNVQDYFGATIPVYDSPVGGNIVDTWTGSVVYFPTTGVTPPTPYGFNNPTVDAWINPAPITAPDFDTFIVNVV